MIISRGPQRLWRRELLSRLRLLLLEWRWWCFFFVDSLSELLESCLSRLCFLCLLLGDSSSDELSEESCLLRLCFLCLLFLLFFFFSFFSILSSFLRSLSFSSFDIFFNDCKESCSAEPEGWLTILYFCTRGSSCRSQAVQRIFMPSSFISSINLFWSKVPTGASESTAFPYNSHNLSVLMWPYLWHLTHRTFRTAMPKGWSLIASSPFALKELHKIISIQSLDVILFIKGLKFSKAILDDFWNFRIFNRRRLLSNPQVKTVGWILYHQIIKNPTPRYLSLYKHFKV